MSSDVFVDVTQNIALNFENLPSRATVSNLNYFRCVIIPTRRYMLRALLLLATVQYSFQR